MVAKRSSAKSRSRVRGRASSATDELGQLRSAIGEIRARIESEARKRGIKFPSFEEAARAPKGLIAEIRTLGKKSCQLRSSLKQALVNPDPWRLSAQARTMLGEMRNQIERRTSEIKDKSEQLNRLLRRSASQALQIIQGKPRSPKRGSSSRVGP